MAGPWLQEVKMEAWPGLGSLSLGQNQVLHKISFCMQKMNSPIIYNFSVYGLFF